MGINPPAGVLSLMGTTVADGIQYPFFITDGRPLIAARRNRDYPEFPGILLTVVLNLVLSWRIALAAG